MASVHIGTYTLEGLTDGQVDVIRRRVEVHLRYDYGTYVYLSPEMGAGAHELLWVSRSTFVWFTYNREPAFLKDEIK